MKEVILIAAKDEHDVSWLKTCLKEQGYVSAFYKTVKELIEMSKMFSLCSVGVPLAIIDPAIWENMSNDLVAELSEGAPDIRFVLLDKNNITFSIDDWLTGSMQHLTILGSDLADHVCPVEVKMS